MAISLHGIVIQYKYLSILIWTTHLGLMALFDQLDEGAPILPDTPLENFSLQFSEELKDSELFLK